MKYIVSYSGGLGSAITLQLAIETYGKPNVIALFADTLMEDPELYEFNRQVELQFDLPLTVISEGRTPWELFRDEKFIGNSRVDLCSRILKREFIFNWIKSRYRWNECEVLIGIDWSEYHRLPGIIQRYKPYIYRSLLIDKDIILTPKRKELWCKERNLNFPRLYKLGFAHNNCGGFCIKAGLGHYERLYKKLPEVYLYHENKEQELIKENPNLRPFLKKQIKKKTFYLTLKKFREVYLEGNGILTEDELLEESGCNCGV